VFSLSSRRQFDGGNQRREHGREDRYVVNGDSEGRKTFRRKYGIETSYVSDKKSDVVGRFKKSGKPGVSRKTLRVRKGLTWVEA
jgi:hypothetical protein